MKNVTVWYPKSRYSAFSGKLFHYPDDYTREVVDSPNLHEHFEKVTDTQMDAHMSNHDIFQKIVASHNMGTHPERISNGIRRGELNTDHSSFSRGDIIGIDGCFYQSDGLSFTLMELEFTNDN